MRPLRSLMLGDTDHYLSPYIFGVQQGMTRLGHWHSQVSIRQPIDVIERRIADIKPHIIWTHMLMWAPPGSPPRSRLVAAMYKAAQVGRSKVVIHDGDYKPETRSPWDLSDWCALALCNHTFDRSAWKVPTLRWPYFAFAQDAIAEPNLIPIRGDLWFAGQLGKDPVYADRTALIEKVRSLGVVVRTPSDNTLFRTAEIAAGADAVLGFGRPGATGWVDTRVFQYPGAGAILLHDDAGGYLEPGRHFIPYRSGSAESVVEAMEQIVAMSAVERRQLRERAFAHVQENHSSVARVRQALAALGVGNG